MGVLASPGVLFTPSPTMTAASSNYLGSDDFDWLNQYMPETYNQIHDRFGTQDVTGMLEHLGKEMPYESDLIKWTEEGRLTQLGTGVSRSSNVFTLNAHTFRVNETVIVQKVDGSVLLQGIITATSTNTFTALCGDAAGWTGVGTADIIVFADSNEHKKKTSGMSQSLMSNVEHFEQNGVIVKEMVDESGSNLAQRTWLEVTNSEGGVGYVWYFKNYKDTEKRFKNAIESKLVRGINWAGDAAAAGFIGTQGLISTAGEGNIFSGQIADLDDVDDMVERINAQGGIANNYQYVTLSQKLALDDFLKAENVTGLNWGAFDNDEKKAMNLGFHGYKRGNYEFSTSLWRYLDNPTTEGAVIGTNKIHGIVIPSGSKSVYDVITGQAASQPMLHVRYRANAKTNRKYKVTVTGAEAGNSRVDELVVDFMTERALVTLGRNNLFLIKG